MALVLKVAFADEARRAALPTGSAQSLTFDAVNEAIAQVWPDLPAYKAKYRDSEGDLCALTKETVTDFLASKVATSSETILKLELYAKDQKEAGPTREEPHSCKDAPSLLRSWLHMFTMGFNSDRRDILEAQGPKELATKIKAEAGAMSLVIALCWKDAVSLHLQASKGGWDRFFNEGTGKAWGWYIFGITVTMAACCLSIALLCNITLLIAMNNLIESKVEAFLEDAGWVMKVPYLGTVYGLCLYLGALAFLSYFTDGTEWFIIVVGLIGIGCVITQVASTRYIHAVYVANASGVPGPPAKSPAVASAKSQESNGPCHGEAAIQVTLAQGQRDHQ